MTKNTSIAPDCSTSETSIAKEASEYGVKVWAAPWTSKYNLKEESEVYVDDTKF